MVDLCRTIYDRQLSDSAGGNVSVRLEGKIYVSPRFMGSKHRWQITPEMISVLDAETRQVIEGPQELSREVKAHLALYQAFPDAGSVIHAHPCYVQVFTSLNKPLPPMTEYTRKYGTIPCIPPAKAHSQELADDVVAVLAPKRNEFVGHGLAVLLPYHGIICLGHDMDEAYDTLERMEVNARCAIFGAFLRLAEDKA